MLLSSLLIVKFFERFYNVLEGGWGSLRVFFTPLKPIINFAMLHKCLKEVCGIDAISTFKCEQFDSVEAI